MDRITCGRCHASTHVERIVKTEINYFSGCYAGNGCIPVCVGERRRTGKRTTARRFCANYAGTASGNGPGGRERALGTITKWKTKFFFCSCKVTGSGTKDMCPIACRYSDRSERKGFPHGGAGTIQSVEWNSHFCNAERGGNCLCEKITCKYHTDIAGSKPGFSDCECGSFFLHGAFCAFPCLFTEHGIFTDHIKIFF